MNLDIQKSKKATDDAFNAKYVQLVDKASKAGAVVPATGLERSEAFVAPAERPGGGIRGRFPEFSGFWDDPAETVIEFTGLERARIGRHTPMESQQTDAYPRALSGTADPDDVKPGRAYNDDDPDSVLR